VAARIRHPERFIAAFDRATAVHHEAIVPPLAWGQATDGTLHCAYARLEPERVSPGSLSPSEVATIGMQLARALSTVHGAGLVHGAITPERALLTSDRGAQLGALGLFAALSDGGLGVQEATALLSDSAYSSPESQTGRTPDERSDVYSLGAALYELLTGKPPYGGRTTSYVMAAVLGDKAEAEAQDALARPVVEALVRAIEHAPDDRWPSATAFAHALAAGASNREMVALTSARRARGCLSTSAALALALAAIGTALRAIALG
jgi:serine/threonine protein kinase